MAEKLEFHPRNGKWRGEPPPSRLQEWARENDDFHSGFMLGVAVSGFFTPLIIGGATLIGLYA